MNPPKAFVPSSLAVPGKRGMDIMNSFMNASCLQVDRWLKVDRQLSGCRLLLFKEDI